MHRFSSNAGIAIGPILFVIAILGILASVVAAGSSDFGIASVSDRAYNDVYTQANLIRTKINECNVKYGTNDNGDGWPSSDPASGTPVCALTCAGDPTTTLSAADCQGNQMTMQNIWNGLRPAMLPPPSTGLEQWYYINAGASGGRCIWTDPTGSTLNEGLSAGLTHAAHRFSNQEVLFNPGGTNKRFVIWITLAQGTPSSQCTSQ